MSVNYDFWAADGDVLTDIFGSYNFGYTTDYVDYMPQPCSITDITEDSDDFEDSDFEEEDIDGEILSKGFDNIIDDWKIKMEVIIGDGLKKIRKSHKERKLMMKYLPGDRKVQAAKRDIAKEWKIDFQKGFGMTHKKLEKLAADKAREVEGIVKTDVMTKKPAQLNKYKKKVININLKANPESAYGNLKHLIEQLDKMVNSVQEAESPTLHSIPIYSKEARGQVLPAYSNHWLELQRSMLTAQNKQSFMDVLAEFNVKFNKNNAQEKVILKKASKSRVEATNAVNAKKRMLERKLNKKSNDQYQFKQFKKNGTERFLIVKKKQQQLLDMEDIFSDWKPNLVDVFEQRRQAALAARKTRRTRKLSNRAQRKELLKEIDEEEKKKPMSYSDMLKRNLKVPMEDIFEAWRDYLQELDEILSNDSRTSFCKDESVEDILESAECFQKSMLQCGQPTVKSANVNNNIGYFPQEVIFASWRHNLLDGNAENCGQLDYDKRAKYQAENYFASWKSNLNEEKLKVDNVDPESYFEDWMHHFDHNQRNELSRSDSRMLKNKKRNQRRSKKNNQH